MPSGRGPGRRAGLSHERVLVAARAVLAEHGLEGLTMRRLAERVGVAPNALYSHVASKEALVDDLLDRVLAEVEVPRADVPDPVAGLHALMASTYAVLLRHPDLVPVYLARQGARGANAVRLGEVMTGLLARAGVTGPPAQAALNVLVVHTIGFAAFATRAPLPDAEGDESPAAALAGTFDAGLGWLLRGIVGPAPA